MLQDAGTLRLTEYGVKGTHLAHLDGLLIRTGHDSGESVKIALIHDVKKRRERIAMSELDRSFGQQREGIPTSGYTYGYTWGQELYTPRDLNPEPTD